MYIITGGGSGIGRALAQALAKRGQSVLVIGRREQPLLETASFDENIRYLCADVSTHQGRQYITEQIKTEVRGLIHNAGIIEPIMPIADMKESAWRQVMATNVEAPLFLTQSLRKNLINGRVLHIGSGAAYFPVAGWSAYCVSKAALSMLTRCSQLDYDHIAFASVMPGIIDTDMQGVIRGANHMEEEKLEFFKRLKRCGQLLTPETVALFLCWLLLGMDDNRYVSQEWDIYDTAHHTDWLIPPHTVPTWDE